MIPLHEGLLGKIRMRADVCVSGWWPLANTMTYLRLDVCLSKLGGGNALVYFRVGALVDEGIFSHYSFGQLERGPH